MSKRSLTTIGFFYGLIGLSDSLIWQLISNWQTYFYVPPDGPALIPLGLLYGVLMTVNAAMDVIITIPVGHWSDRSRSRWGRRLPWMFFAGLPRLVFFFLLWFPPKPTTSIQNLVYMAVMMVAHGTITGFQQVPYNALLPELAKTDEDRLTISAWAGSMRLIGLVVSGAAGLGIEHWGYQATMGVYTVLALALFYLPFLVLREPARPSAPPVKDMNLFQSLGATFRNRAFLVIAGIHALSTSSQVLIQMIFPFIVTEILLLSTGASSYFYGVGLLATIACYPAIPWLSRQFGKRRAFSGGLLAAALVLPSLLFLGDWMHIPLLIPGLIWVILEAFALASSGGIEAAFIGEIVDDDAAVTGQRREGVYYAALDAVDSIVYSIIAMIPPLVLLLGRGQSDPNGPLGIRIIGALGGVMALGAFFLFRLYPAPPHAEAQEGVLDAH
ncbi:MAG TPA: MFS transporter [Anaerolineae bacterium]|nr:MFS transporter [Anaerolineae bacterium]